MDFLKSCSEFLVSGLYLKVKPYSEWLILFVFNRDLLKPYPEYYVPEVIDELSTQQVFTSEYIEGIPLDQCVDFDQKTRNKASVFCCFFNCCSIILISLPLFFHCSMLLGELVQWRLQQMAFRQKKSLYFSSLILVLCSPLSTNKQEVDIHYW